MSRFLHKARRRSVRGLTLVEVLLAIVVVLIGVTAVVALLTHAAASEERARQKLLTSMACQDLLAAMEDAPFDELDVSNPRWSATDIEDTLEAAGVPNPDVTIDIAPYNGATHMKRVLVRIDYGGASLDSFVEFETLFANDFAAMKLLPGP